MLSKTRRSQQGASLIELMIGITVGLVILAGATKLYVDYINSNRTMLVSTRLNQELRSVADLVARDFRRAGYWGNATAGIASSTAIGSDNQYANIAVTGAANQNAINYRYAEDTDDAVGNTEVFGYRLQNGVLQMSKDNGATWQDLTDAAATTITRFSITPVSPARTVSLEEYCLKTGASYPSMVIREYDIVIAGQPAADSSVKREIREAVRVRADEVTGACPT